MHNIDRMKIQPVPSIVRRYALFRIQLNKKDFPDRNSGNVPPSPKAACGTGVIILLGEDSLEMKQLIDFIRERDDRVRGDDVYVQVDAHVMDSTNTPHGRFIFGSTEEILKASEMLEKVA